MDDRKQTCVHGRPATTSVGSSMRGTSGMSKNDKLFELFIKILKKEGPLDLSGQKIKIYTSRFSKEWHSRIHKFGGLGRLLCSDPRFSILHNVVSIADPLKRNTATPLMQSTAPLKQDAIPAENPWKIDPPCTYKKSLSFDNINSSNLKPGDKDFSPLLRNLISSHNKLRNNRHTPHSEKVNKQIRLFGKDDHDSFQTERSEKPALAKDDIGTNSSHVMPCHATSVSGKDGWLQPKTQDTNESLPSQLPQASYSQTQVLDTTEETVDQLPEKLYFPSAYDRTEFDTASFISEFTMSRNQCVSTQEDTIPKRSKHETNVLQAETNDVSKSQGPFLRWSPTKGLLVTPGNSRLSMNSTLLPNNTSEIKGSPMHWSHTPVLPMNISPSTRLPMNMSNRTGLPIMSHRTGVPMIMSQARGPPVHWSRTTGFNMNWSPSTGLSVSSLPVGIARNWSPMTGLTMNLSTGSHKSSPPTGLPASSTELHMKCLATEFATKAHTELATNKADPEFATNKAHLEFVTNKAHPEFVTNKAHPEFVTNEAHPAFVAINAHPQLATKAHQELATEIWPPIPVLECRSPHDLNESWPQSKDLTQSWPPSAGLTESYPPTGLIEYGSPSTDLTQSYPLSTSLTESWLPTAGLAESSSPNGLTESSSPNGLAESSSQNVLVESLSPRRHTQTLPPTGLADNSTGPVEPSLHTIFREDWTSARSPQETSTRLSVSSSGLAVNKPLTTGPAALNSSPVSKLAVDLSPASVPALRSSPALELAANTSPSSELLVHLTRTSELPRNISPISELSNNLSLTPGRSLNSSPVNVRDLHPYLPQTCGHFYNENIINVNDFISHENNDAHKRHTRQGLFQSSQPVNSLDQSPSYDPWSAGKVQAMCSLCSLPHVISEISVILSDFKDRICALNIPSSLQNSVSAEYSQDRARTQVTSLNTALGLNNLSAPNLNHANTACSSFNRAPGHKPQNYLPVNGKLDHQCATHLRGVEIQTDANGALYSEGESTAAAIQTYINETVHIEKKFNVVKPRNNTKARVHFPRKLKVVGNQTDTSGTDTEQLALQNFLRNMHPIDFGEYKDLINEHFATKNVVSNLQGQLKAAHEDLDRVKSENASLQKQVASLSDLLQRSVKADNGRTAEVESNEQGKRE